jgi:hypothetical protein
MISAMSASSAGPSAATTSRWACSSQVSGALEDMAVRTNTRLHSPVPVDKPGGLRWRAWPCSKTSRRFWSLPYPVLCRTPDKDGGQCFSSPGAPSHRQALRRPVHRYQSRQEQSNGLSLAKLKRLAEHRSRPGEGGRFPIDRLRFAAAPLGVTRSFRNLLITGNRPTRMLLTNVALA